MRKVFLPLILFALLFPLASWSQDVRLPHDKYDIRLPEGMVHFSFNDRKLVVGFGEGVQEAAAVELLNASGLFAPYRKEWKDLLPRMYRPELKEGVSYETAAAALKQLPEVAYTAPVVGYRGEEQALYDVLFVGLNSAGDMALLRELAGQLHFQVEEQFPDQQHVYRCRVTKNAAGNALEIARYLQTLNKFKWAEPDFIYTCKLHTVDPYYGFLWGINNTAQYTGATAGADMDVVNAWTLATGNSSISVAVHDCWGSNAEFTHPDISFAATYDAVGSGFASSGFTGDAHGINCASIIGATGNNNVGTVGVAYGVQVKAVKIGTIISSGGSFSTSGSIRALATTWSYQNADIISNSTGGGSSSTVFDNAIANALVLGRNGAGTLFFSSNGNSNTTTVAYPANNTNTIAVAATSFCDMRKSPNSCGDGEGWGCDYGVGTDVGAPGIRWYATDIAGANGYTSGDYYQFFNGTSSACPATAAVAALTLSLNPTLSAANLRYAIESTCEKVGGYTYSTGVSGQPNGTWSNELGYGRVNAYQALQAANCTGATNDNCANAITLPLNASCTYTSGDLCRATESLPATSCSGSTAVRAADVWYTVTPSGTSGTGVTLTCVSGANTDVVMGIYSGSCTGLTLLQCVDASGTAGTETMTVTGLTSGTTYYVRVYDYFGSTLNTGFQICATQCGPTTPTVTPAGPVTLCTPNTQTLTISNPCTGCSFAWSGGGTGTTKVISATSSTTVTATNTCGTSVTSNSVSVTIDPLPVVPTITPSGPVDLCAGNAQTLTISNPCTSCTFNWSNGGTGTTQSVSTAGSYTATATNSCGTSAASNAVAITVTALPAVPVVTPSGPLSFCNGDSATLTISNPCTGCTFNWSNSDTGITAVMYTPGSYTATATNFCGTSANSNTVGISLLAQPVTPVITPSGPLSICSSNPATLTVSNPCTGCTFNWSNSGTGTTQSINTTGTYTATATNTCGTSATSNAVTVNVTPQPSNPTGASASPAAICNGNSTTLTVNGTLSTGATWVWYTGSCGGTQVGNGTTLNVSPTTSTTYYVRAENGICNSSCAQVTVTVNPLPVANAGTNQTICSGTSVQIGSPFTPGSSYSWTPTTGLSNPNAAQPTATPTATTTYVLTRTITATGCQDTAHVTITVNALPNTDAGPNQVMCSGFPTTLGTPFVNGYLYSWAPATDLNSTVVAMPVTTTTVPVTYTLTVTNAGTNCSSTDHVSITINPLPTADAGPGVSVAQGFGATIGGAPTGTGTGPLSYTWLPNVDLNNNVLSNPYATPASTITYTVTVTDGNGCVMTDTTTVSVIPPCAPPTAAFSASPVMGTCPLVVNFTDESLTSGPVTYEWTIDVNGTPQVYTGANPTALYTVAGSYSAQLIVTDSCGSDTLLLPNYITVTCPVSVPTATGGYTMDIYPNPAYDVVNIRAGGVASGDYHITLQNVLGQVVYERDVTLTGSEMEERVSLAPFANGVYTLQVIGNGLQVARKIEKR